MSSLEAPTVPFPLLGIDSETGSEFTNDLSYRYCLDESITFTRSRPYQKNDQAHVQPKNWSVVRNIVGYDRWETGQALALRVNMYHIYPFTLISSSHLSN